MGIRYIKIILVGFAAFQGAVYGLQNLANLDSAFQFVATVMAMENQPFYHSPMPPITSSTLVGIALALIILVELSVGIFGFVGMSQMLKNVKQSAAQFNQAKSHAIVGCGLGVVVWFGFFMTVGNTVFQMWQTEIGQGVMEGAFQYGSVCILILLFIAMPDADLHNPQ
ncbi:DUF2165 family protein [Neptunicella sp.]|uniref:DUF2165 family protein n=1 Tax=Neptunicella sp. TaxID=2125986 RepID=UPI003F691F49